MVVKRYLSQMAILFLVSLLGISTLSDLAICKENANQIGGPFAISSNGEYLAMTVGPDWRRSRVYILQLCKKGSQVKPIQKVTLTQGMAWRPGSLPAELLIFTGSSNKDQRTIIVKVSDGSSNIAFSWDVPSNLIMGSPVWNPSGKILAIRVTKFSNVGFEGAYLGISYDNAKSVNVTDIPFGVATPVWTNNETLYLQNGNDIWEAHINNSKNVTIGKRLVSAEGLFLAGSIKGRPVYFIGNEIFCGNELLYRSNQRIGMHMVASPYLAFKVVRGNEVVVLDGKGNVINKKRVGRKTKLIALSAEHKIVYLMRDRRFIERYSFINGGEISTVYDVTW